MRNRLLLFAVLLLLLAGTAWLLHGWLVPQPRRLAIAAAADLQTALPEVLESFHARHPDHPTRASYGSSGSFFAQLRNGGPFDVFLSADVDYPRKLIDEGLASEDDLFVYAIGGLVVWAPPDSPLNVEKEGMTVLLDPSISRIAIANPRFAPYGRAAEAALKSMNLYDRVKSHLVLGDNIAQTAQLVQSQAADVGILSRSLALAPNLANGRRAEVPLEAYPRLEQAGLIMKEAQDRTGAVALRDFLRGDEGRAILQRHGFSLPER